MARKKRQWKNKREKEKYKIVEGKYFIFTEGEETEPNYIEGFSKIIECNPMYKRLIKIIPCGKNTLSVVKEAEDYMIAHKVEGGKFWCLFDKDDFPSTNFNSACSKIDRLNEQDNKNEFYAGWSNQCIEFWFILHFARYTSNNDRATYKEFLDDKFNSLHLGKYEKNIDNIYDILKEHGDPKRAIKYAKAIIAESADKTPAQTAPGTLVYKLVEELAQYLPEDERKIFV